MTLGLLDHVAIVADQLAWWLSPVENLTQFQASPKLQVLGVTLFMGHSNTPKWGIYFFQNLNKHNMLSSFLDNRINYLFSLINIYACHSSLDHWNCTEVEGHWTFIKFIFYLWCIQKWSSKIQVVTIPWSNNYFINVADQWDTLQKKRTGDQDSCKHSTERLMYPRGRTVNIYWLASYKKNVSIGPYA